MAQRSIWARTKHRIGLERPPFCARIRAQNNSWGRSNPNCAVIAQSVLSASK